MKNLDLNLLIVLDALLQEGSVVGAAEKLHLSPPSISRALGRIRTMVDDPVFVRAGRGLAPTPRAQELRPHVKALLDNARQMLRPSLFDPAQLERTFTIRAMDSIAALAGPLLASRLSEEAPNVTIRFVSQGDESTDLLRKADIDFDIGVLNNAGPEVMRQTIYREHMVGIVRKGHALSRENCNKPIDLAGLARFPHVAVSRRGTPLGPIDKALEEQGLKRRIALVVQHANAALLAAAASDLVAIVSLRLARRVHTLGLSVVRFELPIPIQNIPISLAWHPRMDADPENRWIRQHVRAAMLESPLVDQETLGL